MDFNGMPGIPIFLPPNFGPAFRTQVLDAARGLGGLQTGRCHGAECVWAPPEARCYRVQEAQYENSIALHEHPSMLLNDLLKERRGSENGRANAWYCALGMNLALFANDTMEGDLRMLVRQTLAQVAAMAGVAQILIDPEVADPRWTDKELWPERNPIYSRNKAPGRNFAPSIIALDYDLVPTDPSAGVVVD